MTVAQSNRKMLRPGLRRPRGEGGSKNIKWEIAIMAYVITDTCTKDELCVEACPTDCIHPKKDEEGSKPRPSFMSIPKAASIVAPAFRSARPIRSLLSTKFPPTSRNTSRRTLSISPRRKVAVQVLLEVRRAGRRRI